MTETISLNSMQFQQLINALNSITRKLDGIETYLAQIANKR